MYKYQNTASVHWQFLTVHAVIQTVWYKLEDWNFSEYHLWHQLFILREENECVPIWNGH